MFGRITAAFAAIGALALVVGCGGPDKPKTEGGDQPTVAGGDKPAAAGGNQIKIGFLVKQPEEQWFRDEWRFAQQAADQDGFQLITNGASDGDKVLSEIDTLAAQGAKGFVICTPDTKLGPAIVAKANSHNLKIMSVDDQFVDGTGKPMLDVHHMGISAPDIGKMMGQALVDEMKKRGWTNADTSVMVMTWEQLETSRQRTDNAIGVLTKNGFPANKIFKAPQKSTDVEGGLNAANIALVQHPNVKHWLVCGMNDEAVLGAVRSLANQSIGSDRVIGVGIGGTLPAQKEFLQNSGFFATVLISPKRHGFETADLMYKWIKDGTEPPKATYTQGYLITRTNYKNVLKEQGLGG